MVKKVKEGLMTVCPCIEHINKIYRNNKTDGNSAVANHNN